MLDQLVRQAGSQAGNCQIDRQIKVKRLKKYGKWSMAAGGFGYYAAAMENITASVANTFECCG